MAKEINVENSGFVEGFRSISLVLNSAIPKIRDAVIELEGVKVTFLFNVFLKMITERRKNFRYIFKQKHF